MLVNALIEVHVYGLSCFANGAGQVPVGEEEIQILFCKDLCL